MSDLYEQDFIAWTEQQARALREAAASRTNSPLDWENIAEEIESSGKSERRALGSEVRRVIQHLLKLECSPADAPRAGWKTSATNARREIQGLLRSDAGLKSRLSGIIAEEATAAAEAAALELQFHGEASGAGAVPARGAGHYTQAQILADWFPGDAAP